MVRHLILSCREYVMMSQKKHAVAALICVFCLDTMLFLANFAYVILILTGQNDYYEETLPFRHLHGVVIGVMPGYDSGCGLYECPWGTAC